MAYPEVGRPDFPAIEARVLARWTEENTFERSVQDRPIEDEYVFYDGPPFANGLPHHGHLLTGYVKDVVPRYQTMRGRRVERRFGWDCHGLPAEMEAEKELPVSGRADIIEFGIDRFNAQCRESVLRYTTEWEKTVTRQARWVDFKNDYKTMDRSYMESVM
ncbi:MAG TPA: isoleucine--tRNA ligase, partial [Acidimicrobiaceae bacterium]|nr:isoleucine--tRNA ligase [Acidimicrobiaceae bacterium]